jgi:hypothetical protein
MIGKSEIVVKAPVQDFFPHEFHPGTYLALQLGKHEIVVRHLLVLTQRSAVLSALFENNHFSSFLINARKNKKNIFPGVTYLYLFVPIY